MPLHNGACTSDATTIHVPQDASSHPLGRHRLPRSDHRHTARIGTIITSDSRSTRQWTSLDRTPSDGLAGAGGELHCYETERYRRNATATPTEPTVPELPPPRPSGGVCGIYSTICDVSSEESTPGRPAAVPDSYGPGTRSGGTGSSYDTGTGSHSESDIGTC